MVKNPPANSGDESSIPGSGRSPGEGTGYPLQYSASEITWIEDPGSPCGRKRVGPDLVTKNNKKTRWQDFRLPYFEFLQRHNFISLAFNGSIYSALHSSLSPLTGLQGWEQRTERSLDRPLVVTMCHNN